MRTKQNSKTKRKDRQDGHSIVSAHLGTSGPRARSLQKKILNLQYGDNFVRLRNRACDCRLNGEPHALSCRRARSAACLPAAAQSAQKVEVESTLLVGRKRHENRRPTNRPISCREQNKENPVLRGRDSRFCGDSSNRQPHRGPPPNTKTSACRARVRPSGGTFPHRTAH
jgi:hypothetical protein